jgi:hypothetical protein
VPLPFPLCALCAIIASRHLKPCMRPNSERPLRQ